MNPEKILCKCKNVTKGDVLKAMKNGAKTYKDVREATGAGSKCGDCEKKIRKFIKKQREKTE